MWSEARKWANILSKNPPNEFRSTVVSRFRVRVHAKPAGRPCEALPSAKEQVACDVRSAPLPAKTFTSALRGRQLHYYPHYVELRLGQGSPYASQKSSHPLFVR